MSNRRTRRKRISLALLTLILIFIPSPFWIDNFFLSNEMLLDEAKSITVEIKYRVGTNSLDYFETNPIKSSLLIPLGRLIQVRKEIEVLINSVPANYSIVKDNYGSSWANFSFSNLRGDSIIAIKVINKEGFVPNLQDSDVNESFWLQSSEYIDSDNSSIIEQSIALAKGKITIIDKAYSIFEYIYNYIDSVKTGRYDKENASQVLECGYGVCRHKARLFVAMCRAIGIPARIISGIRCVNSRLDSGHQWTEILLENKSWHQIDPTWRNFNIYDSQTIDFIVAPYQNSLITSTLLNSNESSSISYTNYLGKIKIVRVVKDIKIVEISMNISEYRFISLCFLLVSLMGLSSLFIPYSRIISLIKSQILLKRKNKEIL